MESINLPQDIKIFYITAASFPEGILAAHQQLHNLIPFSTERKYFGISRPENGPVVYRAAAEERFEGEAKQLNLETLVLKSGNYISEVIKDYQKDIASIEQLFQKLLMQPNLDPNGYCVEWYVNNNNVRCMIRLAD